MGFIAKREAKFQAKLNVMYAKARQEFGSTAWLNSLDSDDYAHLIEHFRTKAEEIFAVRRCESEELQSQLRKIALDIILASEGTYSADVKADHGWRLSTNSNGAYDYGARVMNSFTTHSALFGQLSPIFQALSSYEGGLLAKDDYVSQETAKLIKYIPSLVSLRANTLENNFFAGLNLSTMERRALTSSTSYDVVNAGVKELSEKLSTVDLKMFTVEDQYFVEQVTASHVPAIVDAANRMKSLTGAPRMEAETNFVEQFRLLDMKLTGLIESSTLRMLDEVRAQTKFLTEITPADQTTEQMQITGGPGSLPRTMIGGF